MTRNQVELDIHESNLAGALEAERKLRKEADKAATTYQIKYTRAKQRVEELEQEVRYLRHYGDKNCTAMADAARFHKALET